MKCKELIIYPNIYFSFDRKISLASDFSRVKSSLTTIECPILIKYIGIHLMIEGAQIFVGWDWFSLTYITFFFGGFFAWVITTNYSRESELLVLIETFVMPLEVFLFFLFLFFLASLVIVIPEKTGNLLPLPNTFIFSRGSLAFISFDVL